MDGGLFLWANRVRKATQVDALRDGSYYSRIFKASLTAHTLPSGHDVVKPDEHPEDFVRSDTPVPNYESEEIKIFDTEHPVCKPEDTKKFEVMPEDRRESRKDVLMTWNPEPVPSHNAEGWRQPAIDREVDLFLAQPRQFVVERNSMETAMDTLESPEEEIDFFLSGSEQGFEQWTIEGIDSGGLEEEVDIFLSAPEGPPTEPEGQESDGEAEDSAVAGPNERGVYAAALLTTPTQVSPEVSPEG